jgi:hypothetical protein
MAQKRVPEFVPQCARCPRPSLPSAGCFDPLYPLPPSLLPSSRLCVGTVKPARGGGGKGPFCYCFASHPIGSNGFNQFEPIPTFKYNLLQFILYRRNFKLFVPHSLPSPFKVVTEISENPIRKLQNPRCFMLTSPLRGSWYLWHIVQKVP